MAWRVGMSVLIRPSPVMRANLVVLAIVVVLCCCWGSHQGVEVEEDDPCDP